MLQKSFVWLICATLLGYQASWAQAPVTGGVITLNAVIENALSYSPRLKSAGSVVLASKGERLQAGVRPNPEVGVEAENLAGRGPYKGVDSAEITFGVSQQLEFGGKRPARQAAADRGYEISSLEYEAVQLDLIRDVTIAYADAVAAQEEVKLAEDQKKLAGEVLESVSRRVSAAAEPLIQKSKAEVALATSEIAFSRAVRELEITKRNLASFWGQEEGSYSLDVADFLAIRSPAALMDAAARLSATPDIARQDAVTARARAILDLERANAIPDPTVSVGVRDFRETRDQALMFGVSLPIPVWNKNQGNIARALHEARKSETDKQALMLDLGNALTRAAQEMQTAYGEAESLRTTILPAAERAFSLSRQGYQAGRFPYLEVLDAQRTLFEARSQRNAALKNYHTRRAEVERLTAAHSGNIQSYEEKK